MSEETREADVQDKPGEKKRSVVLAPKVRILFSSKSKPEADPEVVEAGRDVFAVMETITARLSRLPEGSTKEDMEDVLVSVHSLEDPEKSDPPKEGEPRWEGPYMLQGLEIEGKTIPEAMNMLATRVIPNDVCVSHLDRLLEQLFLRSRLDGAVSVLTFDGAVSVVPLLTSFRPVSAESLKQLYQNLHYAAERLRKWATAQFPEIAKDVEWIPKDDKSGIVTPGGVPVEDLKSGKGIVLL